MNALTQYKVVGDRAEFRPVGEADLQLAISLVTFAIIETRRRSIKKLLIEIRGLRNVEIPTSLDRYNFGEQFGRAASGQVRFALVCRPELIDPKRLGVEIALIHGAATGAFESESEALIWLDSGWPAATA